LDSEKVGSIKHTKQYRTQAKILGGAKYFDFKRATAFGLGDGLSKHKTTRDARKLGG